MSEHAFLYFCTIASFIEDSVEALSTLCCMGSVNVLKRSSMAFIQFSRSLQHFEMDLKYSTDLSFYAIFLLDCDHTNCLIGENSTARPLYPSVERPCVLMVIQSVEMIP